MRSAFRCAVSLSFALATAALAQPADQISPDGVWQLVAEPPTVAGAEPWIQPEAGQTVVLDRDALTDVLSLAPLEFSDEADAGWAEIQLPNPLGGFDRFRFVESPVMEPELAAKFPEIRTFLGQGINDPAAALRFDRTPQGFHAQVLSPGGAWYIDPLWRGNDEVYTSYFKRDAVNLARDFGCTLLDRAGYVPPSPAGTPGPGYIGETLRTYRLACAATGEYTNFHGGTVSAGLAAIVTAINRVTGVYELELSVRMVLVANNDLIVYTNGGTDPYSNGSGGTMLGQNISNLSSVIGNSNFDIGHVFSTGGGGVAYLGVVCSSNKAGGVTGLSSPVGDPFYIDYVAHEMGHQYGGNHTFNGSNGSCSGNRNGSTAYEPGSGSTIQAYSGICGADNLQTFSDPYFHSISLDEMSAYVASGSGSCRASNATGNNPPTANAGPNYTIPASTPFALTATGSDPDGDTVTFCWEERDLGPQNSINDPDNGSSPIVRSRSPVNDPVRTIPRISNLRNNTFAPGEKLPTANRTMNFRVVVRDNRAGSGGYAHDTMQVTVANAAGPFVVTQPNTNVTWSGTQTVMWNVAGTNAAPVNTSHVNIRLSTDDGRTFPILLVANTPNDGAEVVSLPAIATSEARIRVEAANSIYFDISNTAFTIEQSALSITLPSGAPSLLTPGEPETFDVLITPGTETIVPGSPQLRYRYDGGAFLAAALTPAGGNTYTATLPAPDCADTPEFYVTATGHLGTIAVDPPGAPLSNYNAQVGEFQTAFEDNFETHMGWTVSGDATDGQWQRGVPVDGDRGDPPSDADGSGQCYVTDNVSGNSDVDGGTTILTSPVLDLSAGGTITYAYWLSDIASGPLGAEDGLRVEVATNAAGTNWTTVRLYTTAAASWRSDSIDVGAEVGASATVRIRFSAFDLNPGDVVEAGVDAVSATSFVCVDPPPGCPEDLDGNGIVDLADLSILLGNFGVMSGADPEDGDLDGDGDVDLADLAPMLAAFGSAC